MLQGQKIGNSNSSPINYYFSVESLFYTWLILLRISPSSKRVINVSPICTC